MFRGFDSTALLHTAAVRQEEQVIKYVHEIYKFQCSGCIRNLSTTVSARLMEL